MTVEPQGRKSPPDEVWAQVRDEYLAGWSAPECCRRHGVGLTALRERAAREGWRRADQPWTPPNRLDPWDEGVELDLRVNGDLDRVELEELGYIVHRRMMRAVMRGDAVEALRWRRVQLTMAEVEAELKRDMEHLEAIRWRLADQQAQDAPDPDASDAPNASDGVLQVGFPSPLAGEGAPEGRMRGETPPFAG